MADFTTYPVVVSGQRVVANPKGVLMSVAPAVHLASLYTRMLYGAMPGNNSWDMPVAEAQTAVPDLV
ncbi:hypothetical protein ABBQ32_009383 [Trebouxia sp. C0010 RCD-2024]